MTYQDFKQEWQGRRIDFDHSGTYLASDLIREYAFSMYKLGFDLYDIGVFWYQQPEGMSDYYFQSNDMTVKQGDFVIINDYKHVVIANGEQTPERFECLEQNVTGSGKGDGDDAIRENWYDKALIKGIYRARFSPDKVAAIATPAAVEVIEPIVEPLAQEVALVTPKAVAKPYKHPTGALRVPLNRVEFKVVTDLWGYAYMSHAQAGGKPVERIKTGKYFMTSQQGGMAKIDTGDNTQSYWINPADNVTVNMANAFRQDTRHTYYWFRKGSAEDVRPLKYQLTGDYMKRNKKAVAAVFKVGKPDIELKYGDVTLIAGTFVEGERRFGIPAYEREDGTFGYAPSYGIPTSYMEETQEDYVIDDDLIQDVQPLEAEAFLPARKVSFQDRNYAFKGKTQRLIDNFIRVNKE